MKNNEMLLKIIGEADEKYIPEIYAEQLNIITSEMSENNDRSVEIKVVSQTKKNKFIKWFAVCGGLCASIMLIAKLTSHTPNINKPAVTSMVTTSVSDVSESMVVTQDTTAVTTTEPEMRNNTAIRFRSIDGSITETIEVEGTAPSRGDYFAPEIYFNDDIVCFFIKESFNLNGGGSLYIIDRHSHKILDFISRNNEFYEKIIGGPNGEIYYFYSKYENNAFRLYVRIFDNKFNIVGEKNLYDIFGENNVFLEDVVLGNGNTLYCLYTVNGENYVSKIDFENNQLLKSEKVYEKNSSSGAKLNFTGELYLSMSRYDISDRVDIIKLDKDELTEIERHTLTGKYREIYQGINDYEFILKHGQVGKEVLVGIDWETIAEDTLFEVGVPKGSFDTTGCNPRVLNGQIITFESVMKNEATTENSSTEDSKISNSVPLRSTDIQLYSLDGELTENILLDNISPGEWDYTSSKLCFDEENVYVFMGKSNHLNGGGNLYFVNRHTGEIIDSVYYDSGYLRKMIYDNNKNMCYFYNYGGTATVRIFDDGLNILEEKNLTDICDLSDMNLTDAVFDGDILYCLWTNNDKYVMTKVDFNNNQLIAVSEIDLNGYYINIAPSGKLYVSGTDSNNTDGEMQIANIDTETLEIVDKINTGYLHNIPDDSGEYDFVMAGTGEYEFIIRRYDSVEEIEEIIAFDADTMSEKVILEVEKKRGNWFASNDVRVCNGQLIVFNRYLNE